MNQEQKIEFIQMLQDRVLNKEKSRSFENIVELIDAKAFHRGYQQGVEDARSELSIE